VAVAVVEQEQILPVVVAVAERHRRRRCKSTPRGQQRRRQSQLVRVVVGDKDQRTQQTVAIRPSLVMRMRPRLVEDLVDITPPLSPMGALWLTHLFLRAVVTAVAVQETPTVQLASHQVCRPVTEVLLRHRCWPNVRLLVVRAHSGVFLRPLVLQLLEFADRKLRTDQQTHSWVVVAAAELHLPRRPLARVVKVEEVLVVLVRMDLTEQTVLAVAVVVAVAH
jgi:hypothetical protein